jgi:uncharacterized membrane protein
MPRFWTDARLATMLRQMAKTAIIGNARDNWRFPLFLAVLIAGTIWGARRLGFERGFLTAFDAAAILFLASCAPLLSITHQRMRQAATATDTTRAVRLVIGVAVTVTIFVALTAQIVDRAALGVTGKLLMLATVVLVWTFVNTLFTLHYAHLYYSRAADGGDCGGLEFPGGGKPEMSDFAYFAFTIGVAVQTADVAISSPRIRRIVTMHALLGFFFNIGVLALTLNVISSP